MRVLPFEAPAESEGESEAQARKRYPRDRRKTEEYIGRAIPFRARGGWRHPCARANFQSVGNRPCVRAVPGGSLAVTGGLAKALATETFSSRCFQWPLVGGPLGSFYTFLFGQRFAQRYTGTPQKIHTGVTKDFSGLPVRGITPMLPLCPHRFLQSVCGSAEREGPRIGLLIP